MRRIYVLKFIPKDLFAFDDDKHNWQKDQTDICEAASCFILRRNERDKIYYTVNGTKRNKLYFIDNNVDADVEVNNIALQQILDSLHCYVYHALRIDETKYIDNGYDEQKDEKVVEEEEKATHHAAHR